MKIKSKDKYLNQYEATIVESRVLPNSMYEVSYYDDEGQHVIDVVGQDQIVLENNMGDTGYEL